MVVKPGQGRVTRLALVALVGLAGCRACGAGEGTKAVADPAPSSTAPVAPSAPRAAPLPAPPAVDRLARRAVAARDLPDGSALGEFTFQRDEGDEGLVWLAAAERCAEEGLRLCTSTQWQAACEGDPAVAGVETWTATPDREGGFVVRGGGGGCRGKRSAPGAQASPFRAGACCSAALAALSTKTSPAMLQAMAKSVLALERAFNQRRGSALRELLDERVDLFKSKKSRTEVVDLYDFEFRKYPDAQVIHERCDFSADEGNETYTADCQKIARQGGKVGHVLTRYVLVGGSGKLRAVTDPQIYRPFAEP